ncbi:MAG: L,D-transpeptidase family protein [Gammaproteobacteria bacterium]|nr:L,D-transpeptidase family protein [Gammaproteobacteria bacterium]
MLRLAPGAVMLGTFALAAASARGQPAAPTEELRVRVEALAVAPRIDGAATADPWFLIRFYERRRFAPAWDDARLDALLRALDGSDEHGLAPDDYHVDSIRAHRAGTGSVEDESPADARIHLDILATDALARYAFHLRFGKVDPEMLDPAWNFTRTLEGVDAVNAVQRLMDAPDMGDALRELAPREEHYEALLDALAAYRAIERAGGWPDLPAGETLRAGMRSPRVAQLRERLRIGGYLDPAERDAARGEPADPELFDRTVERAVTKFQRLHGLTRDGAVGAGTLAALNVPVRARIDQLRVNLERVRWIFRDLEPRYVLANIARFRVSLIENDETIWTTRAVVGRPYRQTPSFRARMTYLVLNPTWTVPPGIMRADLLPELRRDPAALARRNMVVLDTSGNEVDPARVDWNASPFPYMLRQHPGPDNALGRVKFMFPNPHHVYMHDTPSRELFERADRTFSSGCIRLENPLELAELLLAETGQWDRPALERALANGRQRTVNLPRPLTVLLIYATAVPEEGELYLLADVYGRDARLLEALNEEFRFSPPAGYENSLLPLEL